MKLNRNKTLWLKLDTYEKPAFLDKTYLDWVIWIRNNILSSYNFLLHFARKLLTVKHCYQIHKLNQQVAEIA